jgi:hypothetical protein
MVRHGFLGVAVIRRGGLPETAQVRRDHCVPVGKLCDQRQPHMAGLGKAVQQHDRVALARDEIMQLDAVDVCEIALRRLRHRAFLILGRKSI